MKHLFSTLATLCLLAAPAAAQTIKSLGFNTTNGNIVAATNVTFTNSVGFATNSRAATRTNLGLGWSALTNINAATSLLGLTTNSQVVANTTNMLTFTNTLTLQSTKTLRILGSTDPDPDVTVYGFNGIVGWGGEINVNTCTLYSYSADTDPDFSWGVTNISYRPIAFNNTTNAANTRANLGLPLAALTNTSNVTAMRALSGSTNTNAPYSGSVSLTNTNTLVFSNGILQSIQ